MYIKIFESRQSVRSYLIRYTALNGKYFIEDENHRIVEVKEEDLYKLLNGFMNGKLNEKT